jgi:three-Cys-motif partner protein
MPGAAGTEREPQVRRSSRYRLSVNIALSTSCSEHQSSISCSSSAIQKIARFSTERLTVSSHSRRESLLKQAKATLSRSYQEFSLICDARRWARMAPAFLFVDPYGFKIPRTPARRSDEGGRVELFVNVMWRELDMLVQQRPASGTPHADTLGEIFGSAAWRMEIVAETVDGRLYQAIRLLARGIGAKWWTSAVRMVTRGHATRYLLLHLTNSDDGRDLMKACSWSIFPGGEFLVRKSDNPDQPLLFEVEPSLAPLREWVFARLRERSQHWQELHDAVRSQLWLEKHVNAVVRALKKEGVITADLVPGRVFSAAANPMLRIGPTR